MQVLSKKERDSLEKIYGCLPQVNVGEKERIISRKQLMLVFTNLMYLQLLASSRRETFPIPFIGDVVSIENGVMTVKLSPLFEKNIQRFEAEMDYDIEEMIMAEIMAVVEKHL